MLSIKNRFHGHGSVRKAYRLGKPIRGHLFGLHVNKNTKGKNTKVAVVVSKKIHKSAVKRNRIRRRVYEVVRHELPNIKKPTEIVITIYSLDIKDIPHADLVKNIREAFKKGDIY